MTNRGYVSGNGSNAQVIAGNHLQEVIKWAEIGVEIAKLIMDGMSTVSGKPKEVVNYRTKDKAAQRRSGWKKGGGKKTKR